MGTHLLVGLIGLPVAWHLAIVVAVYYDAGRVALDRRRWTAIALLVPLFGGFAYLLERSELGADADDPYEDRGYNFRESRPDEDGEE